MADCPYRLDKRLMVVPVTLYGRSGRVTSEFVMDTGASANIIDHTLAFALGYSARDGIGYSKVTSVIGEEQGYRLVLEGFEALGKKSEKMEVRCHDLKEENNVEGLIGMAFLEQFSWCVHPARKVISVE